MRPQDWMHPWVLLLLLLWTPWKSSAATTSKAPSTSSLCAFRTVNYITHGLPQQCLTSSRPPASSSTSVSTEQKDSASTISSASIESAKQTVLNKKEDLSSKTSQTSRSNPPTSSTSSPEIAESSTIQREIPTISQSVHSSSTSSHDIDSDNDSPLGNANFLSFEDWKKQNLLKAGQSEHVGKDKQSDQFEPRKRPSRVQNALDSLGDDAEIDLDFSGFVPTGPDVGASKPPGKGEQDARTDQDPAEALPKAKAKARGREAGTTSKERFNYASDDCAAMVLKTNPQAKGSSAVLIENKDSYMLNECSAKNKFLIIELCTDILIDTLVLANFEFFSSTFREVRVSVSDKYPVKVDKWKTLGVFEARNSRDVQVFLVEDPVIWSRYLRFEFLSHYGKEFYCPLSLVRVHGTTMYEDFKHEMDANRGDDDDDDDVRNPESSEAVDALVPEAIAEVLIGEKSNKVKTNRPNESEADVSPTTDELLPKPESGSLDKDTGSDSSIGHGQACPIEPVETVPIFLFSSMQEFCFAKEGPISTASVENGSPPASEIKHFSHTVAHSSKDSTISTESSGIAASAKYVARDAPELPEHTTSNLGASSSSQNATAASSSTVSNAGTSEKLKLSSTGTQSPPPVPTMQESFFRAVQKRLQMLEANSSLSLQYIEEQSRALRDAFGKVEQRQLAKTTTFLEYLNTTVLSELREFRQQYDQLWQSTVIELEVQREELQKETLAINARLGVLADELIFQKRMAMLQMVLLLACFGLVLFSRGSMGNYLELPIMQNMLSRSPSAKWSSVAGLETPTQSPTNSRPSSSHQMKPTHGILKAHHRGLSEDSLSDHEDHAGNYSLARDTAYDSPLDLELTRELSELDEPAFDPNSIVRPSTSPPDLPSGEGPMTPESMIAFDDSTIESRLSNGIGLNLHIPELLVQEASPTLKHLTWDDERP